MSVRVYVAATLSALAEYDAAGAIPESAERVAIPADVEDEESEARAAELDRHLKKRKKGPALRISAATGRGIPELLRELSKAREAAAEVA